MHRQERNAVSKFQVDSIEVARGERPVFAPRSNHPLPGGRILDELGDGGAEQNGVLGVVNASPDGRKGPAPPAPASPGRRLPGRRWPPGPRPPRSGRVRGPGGIRPRRLACSGPGRSPSVAGGSARGSARECRGPRQSLGFGPEAPPSGDQPEPASPDRHTRPSRRPSSVLDHSRNSSIHEITHQSWLLSRECSPHSVFAWPAQRPARSSASPGATARVQGQQPIEGYP